MHIDELPQLWNVLRGEMSMVGPRPERPEFVALLREKIPYYDLRSLVPPGITGWAQIRYPYAASLEEAATVTAAPFSGESICTPRGRPLPPCGVLDAAIMSRIN